MIVWPAPAMSGFLWAVASIPDFRQSLHENHYDMLADLFLTLVGKGVLSADMVAAAMTRLDRLDGDIDTLMTRLAYIRTWTYITHRSDWTDSPDEWQTRARALRGPLVRLSSRPLVRAVYRPPGGVFE